MQTAAHVFLQEVSMETVQSAGEKLLIMMYGGNPSESLDALQYRLYCSKVAVRTTFVQVHTLPPTSAAARFQSQSESAGSRMAGKLSDGGTKTVWLMT